MTHFRRTLFVGLILLGASLSVGCHLGITNRPALFPNIAYSPSYARAGGYGAGYGGAGGNGCGPAGCYREFGPNAGCGGWLFRGPNSAYGYGYGGQGYGGPGSGGSPTVTGPVYDAPVTMMPSSGGYDLPVYGGGYSTPAPTPGCAGCGASGGGMSGIPIAGTVGGPPIAVSPAGGGMPSGPYYGGVPNVVPGGGPVHGVPYDSGAVPTLKPPPGSIPLQMPSEMKEAKKIAISGK